MAPSIDTQWTVKECMNWTGAHWKMQGLCRPVDLDLHLCCHLPAVWLETSLTLDEPQFPHVNNGNNNIFFKELWKAYHTSWVHSGCLINIFILLIIILGWEFEVLSKMFMLSYWYWCEVSLYVSAWVFFFHTCNFAHCVIVKGSHREERNTVFEIKGHGLIHFVIFSPISDTHFHL